MVIGRSNDNLCTIVDPEVTFCQLHMNNNHEMDTINLVSTNSDQESPKEATLDDADNNDQLDRIEISEEYSEY